MVVFDTKIDEIFDDSFLKSGADSTIKIVANSLQSFLSLDHFTLLPYVLYSDYNKNEKLLEITTRLIQSNSLIINQRALTFASAFSQNKNVSKLMSMQSKVYLSAALKFIDSQTSQFSYISIRLAANLFPFLSANEETEEFVRREIEVAKSNYANNVRMITLIFQSFLLFQKNEWSQLSMKCNFSDFISVIESNGLYNNNNALMSLINKLKSY